MSPWFDESRLDDDAVLGAADPALRQLAESGARVRREVHDTVSATAEAVSRLAEQQRPRAVLAAGPDSRLLRAVLEPWCPVPFVAWPAPTLPGWVGGMDLVVMLAPDGSDRGSAAAVAEAVRRGCPVVVACPAGSLVAEHAAGRDTVILPTVTRDPLATAVVTLEVLDRLELGPRTDPEDVASALDDVAVSCSPHRDLAVNPAKMLAIALADAEPVVWGGSALAARAARRLAESLRRTTGRSAVAGDAEHLLPLIEGAPQRDVFDDPFSDSTAGGGARRPVLVVLDDGADAPVVREQAGQLRAAAASRGVRVETTAPPQAAATDVARYASLLVQGSYATTYLAIALVDD